MYKEFSALEALEKIRSGELDEVERKQCLDIIESTLNDFDFMISHLRVNEHKDIGCLSPTYSTSFDFGPMEHTLGCIQLWNIKAEYIRTKK